MDRIAVTRSQLIVLGQVAEEKREQTWTLETTNIHGGKTLALISTRKDGPTIVVTSSGKRAEL